MEDATGQVRTPALTGNEYPVRFSPDGLTEQLIDVSLREVEGAAGVKPRPGSALVDGQAALRRYRHEARRCTSAVVRALPVREAAGGLDGWAA